MTDLDAVRTRMRTAAGDVTALRDLLLEIRASVPPSAQETSQEDLDADPDVPTELRAVLDHVLSCLEPLGTDLLSAAAYEPAPCVRDALPGVARSALRRCGRLR